MFLFLFLFCFYKLRSLHNTIFLFECRAPVTDCGSPFVSTAATATSLSSSPTPATRPSGGEAMYVVTSRSTARYGPTTVGPAVNGQQLVIATDIRATQGECKQAKYMPFFSHPHHNKKTKVLAIRSRSKILQQQMHTVTAEYHCLWPSHRRCQPLAGQQPQEQRGEARGDPYRGQQVQVRRDHGQHVQAAHQKAETGFPRSCRAGVFHRSSHGRLRKTVQVSNGAPLAVCNREKASVDDRTDAFTARRGVPRKDLYRDSLHPSDGGTSRLVFNLQLATGTQHRRARQHLPSPRPRQKQDPAQPQ